MKGERKGKGGRRGSFPGKRVDFWILLSVLRICLLTNGLNCAIMEEKIKGKRKSEMKIAIVEDDPKWSELLQAYIGKYAAETGTPLQTEQFSNGMDFVSDYDFTPDIVLMDIEMPHLNGLDAARKLRKMDRRVAIMFITNMAQYAIRGYEVDAVDFVVKPIQYRGFAAKLEKALRYCDVNRDKTVQLKTESGTLFLPYSSIYYVESDKHYVVFHTKEGDVRSRATMEATEKLFSAQNFARCSKYYLVNLAYVKGVTANSVRVYGVELVVGRTKKTEFMDKLALYFGSGGQ